MSRKPQTVYLDFLLPNLPHVTPGELAGACGYSSQHILCSIDSGHLGAFQIPGRRPAKAKPGDKDVTPRLHTRIPIDIARTFLLTHSTGLEDDLVLDQYTRALSRLPRHLLAAVHAEAAKQLRTR